MIINKYTEFNEPTFTNWDVCKNCYGSICQDDGFYVCTQCGLMYDNVLENSFTNNKNNINQHHKNIYKRTNHFKDIIKKIQIKYNFNISDDVEKSCINLFNQINYVYYTKIYENNEFERKNFLNYNYILARIFELLNLPDYVNKIPPFKCKKILKHHNSLWNKILIYL